MRARRPAWIFLVTCGAVATACGASSKPAPLPAGPPPEYEPPRSFDAGGIDELAPSAPAPGSTTPPP